MFLPSSRGYKINFWLGLAETQKGRRRALTHMTCYRMGVETHLHAAQLTPVEGKEEGRWSTTLSCLLDGRWGGGLPPHWACWDQEKGKVECQLLCLAPFLSTLVRLGLSAGSAPPTGRVPTSLRNPSSFHCSECSYACCVMSRFFKNNCKRKDYLILGIIMGPPHLDWNQKSWNSILKNN